MDSFVATPRPTLVITENHPPDRGGMAQSADRIVRGLRQRGFAIDVAHLSSRYTRLSSDAQNGGKLWRIPLEEDAEHALNLMWNAMSTARPSQVVAFGGVAAMLAAPVFAAWWHVPLIVLLRGNDFDAGVFSLRRGWALREALSRAARICVVSRDAQRKVTALFPDQRVHYIPNGMDADEFRLHDFDRQRAREWREREAAAGRRVIGLFGHLKQKKGGTLLLDALRRAGVAGRFRLLVVGDVDEAMAAALNAIADIAPCTKLPFLDRYELLPWYAACDVVAIPSHYDGLPNVALEAASLGIPLLAASAGGLADLLPETAYPLRFAPGDTGQCTHAIAQAAMLEDAALLGLGARLRERVLRDFHHIDETARYAELLRETAQEKVAAPIILHDASTGARSV